MENRLQNSQKLILAAALLLIVPYTTGGIVHLNKAGLFPIAPRNYLVAMLVPLGIYAFTKPPRINLPLVALLTLISIRIGDALFLHRVPNLDNQETMSALAAALVFTIGVACLTGDGVMLRYVIILCGSISIVICSGVNGLSWQNPNLFAADEGRSAGMLGNANASANAIVAILGLVLAMTPPLWLASGLLCVSAAGVYFTLSRGGAMIWVLITIAYVVLVARSKLRRVLVFGFWIAMIVLLLTKIFDFQNPMSAKQSSAANKEVSSRESQFFGQQSIDANDDGRVDLLKEGIKGIQEQPILGYGTGASLGELYSPHNEFVAVWLDNGIIGMLIFSGGICLLVGSCILKNKVLLIGCIPIVAEIPFNHNLLEDKSYLFAWVAVAGMLQFKKEEWTSDFENSPVMFQDANLERTDVVPRF